MGAASAAKANNESPVEDIPCLAGLDGLAQSKSATADNLRWGLRSVWRFVGCAVLTAGTLAGFFLSLPLHP